MTYTGLQTAAFANMTERLVAGDTSLVGEMHGVIAGLKVLVSTQTSEDLETARRAMGGHGFSEFAGIGRMYADHLPGTTCEFLPQSLLAFRLT